MKRIDLVGPKGYSHGWVFHGVPGVTPHAELLKMRTEARAAHPQGHPERLKAERAVRHSRKLGNNRLERGEAKPRAATPRPTSKSERYYRPRPPSERGKPERTSSADAARQERELRLRHEALYRAYPKLSWDSFEQNAVDQGHSEGSAEYHKSVLAQARAALEESRAPKHRGVTIETTDPGVQQYLYNPGEQERFKQRIGHVLDVQHKHAPSVIENTHVQVMQPDQTMLKGMRTAQTGSFVAGMHRGSGMIQLHPKLAVLRGKGENESSGHHVPTDPGVGRFGSSLVHEIGHGVHRHLPQGGFNQDLWNTIADSIGAQRPKLEHNTAAGLQAEWRKRYPGATGAMKDMIDNVDQRSVDQSDALLNRKTLLDWVHSNTAAVRNNVSGYATETPNELMAELWLEATQSSNPRAAARAYREYVKKNLQDHEFEMVTLK